MFKKNNTLLDRLNITKTLYSKFDRGKDKSLSKNLITGALEEVYQRGDKVMTGFITLHMILALLFASFNNTWFVTLAIGISAWGVFLLCVYFYPSTFFTRVIAGIILQVFVLLHVYQLAGLPEVRYFFFVSFTMMIVYQDWRAMWPSALLFFGQLFLFTYLGNEVDSLNLVNKDYENFILYLLPRMEDGKEIDLLGLGFYFGISVLHIVLTGIWAAFLKLQTISEANDKHTLMTQTLDLEKSNFKLEENVTNKTRDLQEALEASQANEEELRQNMEELQATQDELRNQSLQLLDNQEAMQKVEKELRQRQAEMEKTQWIESNLSRFDELMRLNYDKNLEEFSEIILLHLAELILATQGAFYIYEEDTKTLKMSGGYACTNNTVKKALFKEGEGIVGQVAKTKKLTYLEDLPEEGVIIESALIQVKSKSLLIMPLLYNEHLEGVLEIAVFNKLNELHLEFVQRLSKNIASMLQSIRSILRTQDLLLQSQKMTAQLQQSTRELELTKQEVELKAQEFQRLFSAINYSMLVVEYTTDGNILSVNDNFLRLSRFSREELIGKHQSIFLADHFVNSKEYKLLWDKINSNNYVDYEYECLAKHGKSFWVKSNYYMLGDGEQKKIMNLAYDTTLEKRQDRKIMESLKELKEKEEILRQNLEETKKLKEVLAEKAKDYQEQLNAINISTALIEYDANGIIKYVNDKFLEMTGYKKNELIGKSHKVLVEDKFANSNAYQKFWKKLQNREFIDGEFEIVTQKGNLIWLRGSYYPVADNKGTLIKVMQLATNITHEMQQEEQIKDYLMNLEIMQTGLKDKATELKAELNAIDRATGILELNPEGNIIRANPKFLNYCKYKENELEGKPFQILLSDDFIASSAYKEFWQKLNKNEYIEDEFEIIAKDKSNYLLHCSFYPVPDAHNKIFKIIGIISDVTLHMNELLVKTKTP